MANKPSIRSSGHQALKKKLNDVTVDVYNISQKYSDLSMKAAGLFEGFFKSKMELNIQDSSILRSVDTLNEIYPKLIKVLQKMAIAVANLIAMKNLSHQEATESGLKIRIHNAGSVCTLLLQEFKQDLDCKAEILAKAALATYAEGIMMVAYWRESFRRFQDYNSGLLALIQ